MKKALVLNKAEGFTLVEILVVVTIISLLASIATVSYSRFIKQSRDARRKTDIEQIRAAIELYRNFNNKYPTSISSGGLIADEKTTYMSKVPTDPMFNSGNTYYYLSSDPFQDYTLCAYIEGSDTLASGNPCGEPSLVCNYCMGPYGQL